MKKCIALILFLINVNVCLSQFSGGAGTVDNPYQIASRADMEALADSVNSGNYWSHDKHFRVTQDITDSVRTIIGFSRNIFGRPEGREYFDGTFDGNNKKITLAISTLQGGSTGLFGILGMNAVVRNVEVEGYVKAATSATITKSAMPAAAGIAAVCFGKRIENCVNRCDVHVYLKGVNSGDCGDHTGGIVALPFYGTIHNCVNFGTIEADFHDAGGITGMMSPFGYEGYEIWSITISNCVNFGNIRAGKHSNINSAAGGIAVMLHHTSSIFNCVNVGSVYGKTTPVGGIIGHASKGVSISNCINAGFVEGSKGVGGIAGEVYGCNISNCINVGVVSGLQCHKKNNIGAIVGLIYGDGYDKIINCHYDKQLSIYKSVNAHDNAHTNLSRSHLTSTMLGTALQSVLGNDNWVYSDNLYPMLKYFAGNNLCEIARSPVNFYAQNNATYEPHCKLNTNFTMSLENNIKWWNAFDMVSVAGNNGTVNMIGSDTLYAGKLDTFRLTNEKIIIAEAYKTVPIKVIDTFLLTLHTNLEDGGSVTGAGKFINDTLISITATANSCYHFANWTDSATGRIVSKNEYYEFCFPARNITLIANFVYDSFDLVLNINPAYAGKSSGAGRFACGDDTYHAIEAVPNNACFAFKNWTDENGNVVSESAKDSVVVSRNITLIANFVYDSFDLVLNINPAYAGKSSGAGRFACGDDTYHAIEAVSNNACFAFKNWTDENGNVVSESAKDSVVVDRKTVLTANFSNICDVKFVISAKNHDLVNPNSTNYKIPIYIQPDKNVPADFFEINRLVIEIDNSVFYPKSVDIAGSANFLQNGITIENIKIPALNAGEEVVLFNIIGDILLENTTTSEIIINPNIEFAEELKFKPALQNGNITLNICSEGSVRFVEVAGSSPSLTIKNNPAHDILEVECFVVEKGKYSLKIVDITGRSVTVGEFVASESGAFLFEIDVRHFGIGRYLVVMITPSGWRYSGSWVKE